MTKQRSIRGPLHELFLGKPCDEWDAAPLFSSSSEVARSFGETRVNRSTVDRALSGAHRPHSATALLLRTALSTRLDERNADQKVRERILSEFDSAVKLSGKYVARDALPKLRSEQNLAAQKLLRDIGCTTQQIAAFSKPEQAVAALDYLTRDYVATLPKAELTACDKKGGAGFRLALTVLGKQ